MESTRHWIFSGYQFVGQRDLGLRRQRARRWLQRAGLLGTLLLTEEGVNFSLAGPRNRLDQWLEWAATEFGAGAPVLNRQPVDRPPFKRLRVRIRPEIVTFDTSVQPGAGPGGVDVAPRDWNGLINADGVQLVDTRNDYEYRLGSFEGAVNPRTDSFAGFKRFCQTELDPDRPVAMFCTGGVRCEKAGVWLRDQGFDSVYQLQGGILAYLERVPEEASCWRGECFVFDDRVSVDARLRSTGRVICRGCRKPADGLDPAGNPSIDDAGACALCNRRFDAARAKSLRERARQVALAAARGRPHLGPEAQREEVGA